MFGCCTTRKLRVWSSAHFPTMIRTIAAVHKEWGVTLIVLVSRRHHLVGHLVEVDGSDGLLPILVVFQICRTLLTISHKLVRLGRIYLVMVCLLAWLDRFGAHEVVDWAQVLLHFQISLKFVSYFVSPAISLVLTWRHYNMSEKVVMFWLFGGQRTHSVHRTAHLRLNPTLSPVLLPRCNGMGQRVRTVQVIWIGGATWSAYGCLTAQARPYTPTMLPSLLQVFLFNHLSYFLCFASFSPLIQKH